MKEASLQGFFTKYKDLVFEYREGNNFKIEFSQNQVKVSSDNNLHTIVSQNGEIKGAEHISDDTIHALTLILPLAQCMRSENFTNKNFNIMGDDSTTFTVETMVNKFGVRFLSTMKKPALLLYITCCGDGNKMLIQAGPSLNRDLMGKILPAYELAPETVPEVQQASSQKAATQGKSLWPMIAAMSIAVCAIAIALFPGHISRLLGIEGNNYPDRGL